MKETATTAGATVSIEVTDLIEATEGTVRAIVIGGRVRAPTNPTARWRFEHGYVTAGRRRPPAVFPPPQELPVFGRQRAQN